MRTQTGCFVPDLRMRKQRIAQLTQRRTVLVQQFVQNGIEQIERLAIGQRIQVSRVEQQTIADQAVLTEHPAPLGKGAGIEAPRMPQMRQAIGDHLQCKVDIGPTHEGKRYGTESRRVVEVLSVYPGAFHER